MVSDAQSELPVLLKPDTSELDQVEDRQINVPMEGGGSAGGRRAGGGSAAAGGFAGAEAGQLLGRGGIIAGLLAGVLSQIKIVAQTTKLMFRLLGRALLPAINLLIMALRPLLTGMAKSSVAMENPGRTFRAAGQRFQNDVRNNPGRSAGLGIGMLPGLTPQTGANIGEVAGTSVEAIQSVINQNPSSTDMSDEGEKNRQANIVKEMLDLIP